MGFASGDNIDFAFPGLQNGNRQAGRAAKAKKSDPLARFNAGNAQAAKADDAGAQQGSDVHVIQTIRQGKGEILRAPGHTRHSRHSPCTR